MSITPYAQLEIVLTLHGTTFNLLARVPLTQPHPLAMDATNQCWIQTAMQLLLSHHMPPIFYFNVFFNKTTYQYSIVNFWHIQCLFNKFVVIFDKRYSLLVHTFCGEFFLSEFVSGYFKNNQEKFLFCGFSWSVPIVHIILKMQCVGFGNFLDLFG